MSDSDLASKLMAPAKAKYESLMQTKGHNNLWSLGTVHSLWGDKAVESIKLGLSRKIPTTKEAARDLVSEWELRDTNCCYHGTVEDLLALTDTMVLAVSYRHAPQEEWNRKGGGCICKMTALDELLLEEATANLNKIVDNVIIWHDQVISTRLSIEESTIAWYTAGLLPYTCLRVLKLTPSDPDIESRIWIKAERSLGRMGSGILSANEASVGITVGRIGMGNDPWTAVTNLSRMILSGYWPPDLGYWKNDYQDMKHWALAIICRGHMLIKPNVVFDAEATRNEVDNVEILSDMSSLMQIPIGLQEAEPFYFTRDLHFFLRATAWNLAVLPELERPEHKALWHNMGMLAQSSGSKFTWWSALHEKDYIFGCFVTLSIATTVLAIRDRDGYKLYRSAGKKFFIDMRKRWLQEKPWL